MWFLWKLALSIIAGRFVSNRKILARAFSAKVDNHRAVGPKREIHRAIQDLEEKGLPLPTYVSTTENAVAVLRHWSKVYQNEPEWKSLINKANLRHEVEESIVALHHLHEFARSTNTPFIALDACCGKGLFGTLLSYLAPPGLTRIVLFDKDKNVDWDYMEVANQNHEEQGRPFLETWPGTNLHDRDAIIEKLLAFEGIPIAITGIHLCKTLSPTLVGIVNALGPEKAPYLCLAHCCMPRKQQRLSIAQYESPLQRQARLDAAKLRARARQRGCYVCQGPHHVRECPRKFEYDTEEEWNQIMQQALLKLPCWNCGQVGHSKRDCTHPPIQIAQPPTALLELSSDIYPSQEEPSLQPYCEALASTLQRNATIVDSGLTTTSHEKQGRSNWNRGRKSLFIVAMS